MGKYTLAKKIKNIGGKILRGENPFIIRQSEERWEKQFQDGKWDFLLETSPNIAVVAEMIREAAEKSAAPVRILDVGCGNGALGRELISLGEKIHYTGIDISSSAVTRARQLYPEGTFLVGDIEHPDTLTGVYDIIVFAEVLLYIDYNVIADRYRHFAQKDTKVIISLYRTIRTRWIWWMIRKWCTIFSTRSVANPKKHISWDVALAAFKEVYQ